MDRLRDRLAAWWHSVRFQDREQIAARLRYALAWRIYPRFPAAARALTEPRARLCRPRPGFSWRGNPPPFRFLNEPVELVEHMDWNPAGRSLLWRFHLHYFDWAPYWDLDRLTSQVEHWIRANPPGSWPGWHPYPTSLRIVNWIRAFGSGMPGRIAGSLAAQAAFLERNLEFHLGGNHLLENARALLAAGLFLEGSPARRWEQEGLRLLLRELERQVLPDGGHVERSPWYHLRMTRLAEEAIELLSVLGRPVPEGLVRAACAMGNFALALRHLDGSVPCFHDGLYAETGPRPPASGPRSLSFPASGYYILDVPGGRLIADYGAPGSGPNPGHHHAGVFSFEVSSSRGMVIVDHGTPTYDPGPERDRLRSTGAHNTVRVDGRDQFQLWGAFRVGRRAWVSPVRELQRPDRQAIAASHDGYSGIGVVHTRTIVAFAPAGWLVVDDLAGRGSHTIESFIHLAPGITAAVQEAAVRLDPVGWTLLPFCFSGPPQVAADIYAPGVGDRRSSCTLTFTYTGPLPWRGGIFLATRPCSRLEWESSGRLRLDDLQLTFTLP